MMCTSLEQDAGSSSEAKLTKKQKETTKATKNEIEDKGNDHEDVEEEEGPEEDEEIEASGECVHMCMRVSCYGWNQVASAIKRPAAAQDSRQNEVQACF